MSSKKTKEVAVEAVKVEEVKIAEKKHKAYSWHKNDDGTYSIVTLEYTVAGKASVIDQKSTRLKGRAMLDLQKLLVRDRLITLR